MRTLRLLSAMRVPDSINKLFDVYWIDFAVSDAELKKDTAAEFRFTVNAPDNIIALELIPIRFGSEQAVKTEKKSPEIKVETSVGSISLGEFYGTTVEYKTLRPSILADGLQQSKFGWILLDEMIDQGTKRFAAIMGAPKGTRQITVQLIATIKTDTMLGFKNDVASTLPQQVQINLP